MPDPAQNQPLLQNVVSRDACCNGKVCVVVSLAIGLSFALIPSLLLFTHIRSAQDVSQQRASLTDSNSKQHQAIQDHSIALAQDPNPLAAGEERIRAKFIDFPFGSSDSEIEDKEAKETKEKNKTKEEEKGSTTEEEDTFDTRKALHFLRGRDEQKRKDRIAEAMKSTGRFVGIDLGISCVVASAPPSNPLAVAVDENDIGCVTMPSAVSYDGKLRFMGLEAENRLKSAPNQTIVNLPLLLGDVESLKNRCERYLWQFTIQQDGTLGPFLVDGKQYTPEPCGPLGSMLHVLASLGDICPQKLALAVPDYFGEKEIAAVRDALDIAGLEDVTSLLRHSDALVNAFAHLKGSTLLQGGFPCERIICIVDVGVSHSTVSVVKYYLPPPDFDLRTEAEQMHDPEKLYAQVQQTTNIKSEYLFRRTDEGVGTQALAEAIVAEVKKKIEQKYNCTVCMQSEDGLQLAKKAGAVMEQLTKFPNSELVMESFLPQGPGGLEVDVAMNFNRSAFERAAAPFLQKLQDLLNEAKKSVSMEPVVDGVELVGGGSRIPMIHQLVNNTWAASTSYRDAVRVRFKMDASSVAVGAASWAAGQRLVPAIALNGTRGGLDAEALEKVRAAESRIENLTCCELKRVDVRLRLANRNKDEGKDLFHAKKYRDAIRRFLQAVDHAKKVADVLTTDEVAEVKNMKVSCYLNIAQCYLNTHEPVAKIDSKKRAEPLIDMARTACDHALEIDSKNIKAMWRRSLCFEKLGNLEGAIKEIKRALKVQPEDTELKLNLERLKKSFEPQKKMYSKMIR
eukprot:gnl/MRDRNA2_/MRDRNA2_137114_c0_seq1.p1 gnl/MRDRNA2_/MRDRNA2_137114_c0~~gnl/MRDRNA2_/MRDRNA2_137114_c0_seq1.p1  ORF type:complete len:793 (-),score=173.59 gnl/MRDRNA2_/MRDRNA2_137114_c0_seq1:72-2450(-)